MILQGGVIVNLYIYIYFFLYLDMRTQRQKKKVKKGRRKRKENSGTEEKSLYISISIKEKGERTKQMIEGRGNVTTKMIIFRTMIIIINRILIKNINNHNNYHQDNNITE